MGTEEQWVQKNSEYRGTVDTEEQWAQENKGVQVQVNEALLHYICWIQKTKQPFSKYIQWILM